MGLAFLPAPLGFLAWFALVPLIEALHRRARERAPLRAWFATGWQFGFTFYLLGIHWIALLSEVAITLPWLKYPAWVAAGAYLGLFTGLMALLLGWLTRRSGVSLALAFPFVFLTIEEWRASGELGFPWFQPGYTQHAYVPVIQLAALGSVTLVTLWVLIVNALLWSALRSRERLLPAAGLVVALALPWLWGARVLATAGGEPGPVIALVQGNIPGEKKWSGKHQREILDAFLALSDRAAAHEPKPAIAIWPETATGTYLRRQLDQALALAAFTARTGLPVFSGYAEYDLSAEGRVRHLNAAGLFPADGSVGETYAKRHLVPFGERMPFQWLVPAIGRLDLGQAEWTPGTVGVRFPSAAGPFTTLICFESIFPDLAREDVRGGARWLVNITNDEWFGNSAALYQHAAMAVFRAVENRVPLARCANTGLTMIVDPWGRIVARLPVFEPGVLIERLPAPAAPSWWVRIGDWPGWLSLAVVLLLAVAPRAALTARERAE